MEKFLHHVQKRKTIGKYMIRFNVDRLVVHLGFDDIVLAEVLGLLRPDCLHRRRNVQVIALFRNHRNWTQVLDLHLNAHLLLRVTD